MNISAQTILPTTRLRIIPAWITPDGKASIYSYAEFTEQQDLFTIYDDNFNEVKSFRAPITEDITYTYYTQEREWVTIVKLEDCFPRNYVVEIEGETTGLTEEQVLSYLKENYFPSAEISSLPDGSRVIAIEYWRESEYGKKYPLTFFMQNGNDEWQDHQARYDTVRRQSGDWGEEQEHTVTVSSDLLYIELMFPDGSDGNDLTLTRGIFSDDYNLIYHSLETAPFNTETETSKSWGSKVVRTGYKVYDSTGNLVTSLRLPQGLYSIAAYRDELRYWDLNGNRFVLCPVINDNNEYLYVIYRLDDRNNLSMVATTPGSKIAPRAPRLGEIVTVSLNDNVAAAGCTVRVVSTNGQTVIQEKVPAGQPTLDINTSRLSQGVYVISVESTAASSSDVAKIVVR